MRKSNWESFPQVDRGENKTYLKSHHPAMLSWHLKIQVTLAFDSLVFLSIEVLILHRLHVGSRIRTQSFPTGNAALKAIILDRLKEVSLYC